MKFIYLTPQSISYLITNRQFQSIDYVECKRLVSFLKGETNDFHDGTIKTHHMKNGVVLYVSKLSRDGGIFFDLEQYSTFQGEAPERLIVIFQKVLRFAVRYFDKRTLAQCEILRENKGIVFPFPYTAHGEAYRVVIDRNSYRDGKTMNFLTVYYGGSEETNSPVNFINLGKFYEEYKNTELNEEELVDVMPQDLIQSLNVQALENLDFQLNTILKYEDWNQYLTEPQKKFVYSYINGAERLEGAAGTGKTLSMILKCIYNLKSSDYQQKYIFITHSLATKNHIIEMFLQCCPEIENYLFKDGEFSGNLLVTTIQEWCIKYLGTNLLETEYLDKDAMTSKNLQKLYIESALSKVKKQNLIFYQNILSDEFLVFLTKTEDEVLLEMLQYELGVVIKGRADGELEVYKSLKRPQYGIPCKKEVDFNFIHLIYVEYQRLLEGDAQFDSDDIVLSALSSLNAPIWRRRRDIEGFDACFIDETHLFNFNELCVFPYLNKTASQNNIIFAIDKSQFGGEIIDQAEDVFSMSIKDIDHAHNSHFSTVFRSSSDILNLAYNIMSMGSTLFVNFENPLDRVGTFINADNPRYLYPQYVMSEDENMMIQDSFSAVDSLCKKHKASRAECAIIAMSDKLSTDLIRYCKSNNKPHEQLQSRGDSDTILKAKRSNKFVIAGVDYVGGLEFDYVILVGVDDSRVPPRSEQKSHGFHFSNYAWHRRIYVALTRAKYGVTLFGNKIYGESPMFDNAIINGFVKRVDTPQF